MNRFNRAAASGLTVLALAAFAGIARAEDQPIQVGDLSQPAQAAAFERSLARATTNLCGSRWDHLFQRNAYRECVAAVHEEALGLLSPTQREQYAAATATGAVRVASADH